MRLAPSLSTGTGSFAAMQQPAPSSRGRLSGFCRWAVVFLTAIAALSAAVVSAQAQTLPEITVATSQSKAIVGLDDVQFDLTRTGSTTAELTVEVTLEDWGGFLGGNLDRTVTFSAGSSTATLFLAAADFSSTLSGDYTLLAEVKGEAGKYNPATSSMATLNLHAVSGAAMTMKFSAASYSFNENAASAGRQLTVVAEMAQGLPAPAQAVRVVLLSRATTTDPATSGTDFTPLSARLSIAPSSFSEQGGRQVARLTQVLAITDDDDAESDETLEVTLGRGPGTPAAKVAIANADGTPCSGTTCAATVTIVDDDGSSVTLVLSPASISENGGTTDVTATLSPASSSAFTMTVAASPGSGTDFTLSSPATLSFAANATASSNTVTITATDNDVDAADKSVTVSGSVTATGIEAPTDVTLTITDDDTRGVAVSESSLTFAEGADGTYTVKLDTQPTDQVTVAVAPATGSDSDVSVAPASLIFSTMNWQTAQTVTVSATQDADTTDDSATIEHTVSGGDYQGLRADSVAVTVTEMVADNTPPGQVTGVTVTPAVGSLVVAWTAVTGADGYKVQWKSGVQDYSTTERIHTISSGSTETYTIAGLTGGTAYTVQVSATRADADNGQPSSGATGTPRAAAPAQVTGVAAAGTSTVGELMVDWTAATNAGGYIVQWKSGVQDYSTTERIHTITSNSTLTYTITSLTGGTAYTVQVTATRTDADNGQPSSGTTGTPRAAAPAQVTGVAAAGTSTVGELKVDWTAADNADGYKVQWKSGDQNYSTTERIHTISSGSTETYTITGLTGGTAYTVQVSATREHASDGTPSAEASGTPRAAAPAQVTGVTAAKTSTVGELKVDWTAATNAGGYIVQWKSGVQDYSTTERIHTITSNSTLTYTITSLTGGTAYTVQVTATRADADNGQPSSGTTGTPRAAAPAQVTGVAAAKTSTVGELKVDWTAADNADGYKVQWRLSTQTDSDYGTPRERTVSGGSTLTYTIAGLTGATAYTVRVIATREHASDGTPSAEASGTPRASPPGQVGGVTVTPAVESLVVRWSAVTNADGYKVQWRLSTQTDSDYDTTRQRTVSSGSTLTDTIPSLDHTLTYTVRVTATREHANDGTPSSGASARPRAPAPAKVGTVTLTVGVRQLGMAWPQATDADGYLVQWKSDAQSYNTTDRQHTIASGTTLTDTITGLTPGTSYDVQVIATRVNADNGAASDEQTATPKAESPAQVTGLSATPVVRALDLEWPPATASDGVNAGGYIVQWKSGVQGYNTTDRQHEITDGSTAYTIPTLDPANTYTIHVRGTRLHADPGPWSVEATGRPMNDPPAQVTGLTLTREVRQLVVEWSQATNADGYKVQWKSGDQDYNEGDRQHVVSSGTTLTDTITGLTPGTPYTVQVSATRDNAPDGAASDAETAVPKIERPGAVTGVVATPQVEKLAVTWSAATNAGGYKVQWKSGSEEYDPATREQRIAGGALVAYTIASLDHTLTYTVRVLATRQYADDGDADEATGRPRAPAPAQVTGVNVTPGIRQLDVNWAQTNTATGYRVQWRLSTETDADYGTTRQAVIGSGSTTNYTITSLDDGELPGGGRVDVVYTVRVIATRDNADDGPPSAGVSGRPKTDPPGTPTELFSNGTDTTRYIGWVTTDNADTYRVEWASVGSSYSSDRAYTLAEREIRGARFQEYTIMNLRPGTAYKVRVFAVRDNADDGPPSAEITVETSGEPPEGRTTATLTPQVGALTVSWTAVSGATRYRVQWKSGDQEYASSRQQDYTDGTTSHTIPSLTAGTTYTVRVITTVGGVDGASLEATGAVRAAAPGAVASVTLTPEVRRLAVSWVAATDADGYRVQWKSGDQDYNAGDRQQEIGSGTSTSTVITNLDPRITYTVRVAATRQHADAGTAAEASAAPSAALPGQVTGLAAAERGDTTIRLTWTAPADDGGADITGYRIEESDDGGTSDAWAVLVASTGTTATTYDDTGLAAGTTRHYRVSATNADGAGQPSLSDSATTRTQSNQTPVFADGASASREIVENSAADTVIGSPVTATDPDTDELAYSLGGTEASSFTIDADNGQLRVLAALNHEEQDAYEVTVTVTDALDAEASIPVTITVTDEDEPPAAPAAPTVTATSGALDSLTVTWAAPDNTGPPITSYGLQYRTGSSGPFTDGPQDVAATDAAAISATLEDLQPDTSYQVQVRATNDEGDSPWSEPGSASTSAQPNRAPVFDEGATATRSVAENTIADEPIGDPLAATDADGNSLTYSLQEAGAERFGIVAESGQLLVLQVPDFEAAETHALTVQVTDGNGGSDAIAVTVDVTDEDEPPAAPAAPTVTATSGALDSLTVTWAAPDNTGPPITSYGLQYRTGSSGPFTDGPQDVAATDAAAISATLEDLQPDTSYQVQVRATNDEGDSPWSEPGSASTSAQPNRAPVFDEGATATRSVAENTIADEPIGDPLAATDADGNSLTYSLQEAGAERFGIVAESGQLLVLQVPDFEAAETHALTVQVTDGNGGSDAIAVTVDVTDEDEPPAAPAAPTVTATSGALDSLTVTWAAPDNTGPPITSYGLQYRVLGSAEAFIAGPQGATETSATLAELTEVTVYEVQVRATSDEGTSSWSSSGVGSTGSSANATPEFVEGASAERSVAENTAAGAAVGEPLTATDADADNTLTYALEGTDAASFAIDAASGQLRTLAALDFETNAVFAVTVRADDARGGSGRIAVTIHVTDEEELPATPGAPTVATTGGTTDSLTVTWAAPDNTGPPITSYDLQYRVLGSAEAFIAGPQGATETSATLAELTEVTVYEVQVQATNDEGTSSWSSSGVGSTGSSANATPEFVEGASAERSVAENTAAGAAVGEPLTATDADADDTLTYALEGTDAASFAIDAASGQLRTLAALDFETNAVFAVTVRADDARGGSGRIAVTIHVTDEEELPATPGAPTVATTGGTTDSLTVTWTAPDNTGPPITGYDVQYRDASGEEFIAGPQNVAETSAVIAELTEDSPYVVQVRARNADGISEWSPSGIGRTGAPAPAADVATVTIAATHSTAVVALDYVQFDLARTGATTEALSVTANLSQTGGTFLTNTDSRTVTFGVGSSTATLFLATGAFSSAASGSGTLTAAVGASSEDYSVGTAGSASVSLSAVSGAAMTVRLSAASYSFNEDAAAADRQVTVVAEMAQGLPAPGSAVSVDLMVGELGGPDGARSGVDFTPLSARLSITPMAFSTENGRQVARVTQVLVITNDTQSEGDEMLEVRLAAAPGTPAKVAFRQGDGVPCSGFECFSIVTIADDDAATLTVSPAELTIVEGGGATYTVVRTTQPRGNVTVAVGGASGDVTVSPTTLTFTMNNWETPQTVTVHAASDDDTETDAAVTLTHTATGGGYDGTVASVVVRVEEVVRAANNQDELESERVSEGESKVFEVDVDDDTSAEKTVLQVRVAAGDLDDGSLQVSESEATDELSVSVTGGLLDGANIRVPLSEGRTGDTIEVKISLADAGDGMVTEARETPPPAEVEQPEEEPLVVDISVPSGTSVCLPYDPADPGVPVIYHFDGLQWERHTVMNQEIGGQSGVRHGDGGFALRGVLRGGGG